MRASWSALLLLAACSSPGGSAATPAADSTPPAKPAPAVLTLGDCVKSVQAAHAGTMVKVEGKTEDGKAIYEFDVRSPDGTQWDIECEALTGTVTEVEQEVNAATDEPFKAKVKVTEADARKTALAAHPGEITEVEYEIEPDGAASYEFDVKLADGSEMKVEVDATSGAIVEANPEHYQIGVE